MRTASVIAIVVAALLSAAPRLAQAQSDYPIRPVSLIVPYASGGVADVAMRLLGDKLSNRLGQQFVIENRPGAGGIVAAQTAAGAPADGYTLLMTGNNNAIAAALFTSLPYNVLTDFTSVSTASFFDLLLVTRAGSLLHSVQDVVAAARANPGKLNIGTINPGSTQNLAAELFASTAGIKVAIVPFRTSPDMAGAVLRGDIDIAFEFYAAVHGLLADKKLVTLASAGPVRAAYLPDVPTVVENGLKDYEVTSWNGGHAEENHRYPQSRGERGHALARHSKQSPGNGHGDALEHAGRDDRADEGGYRQMGSGDRESRHRQARLRPLARPAASAYVTGGNAQGLRNGR
jgi:tripartite-type tricarboxylate transporter receptor subunit TctC